MEYYDSVNKTELYQFYFEKSNSLLKNSKVIEVLDQNTINFKENSDIKLFKMNPYQIVKGEINSSNSAQKIHSRRRSLTETETKTINIADDFGLTQYKSQKGLQKQVTMKDLRAIVIIIFYGILKCRKERINYSVKLK